MELTRRGQKWFRRQNHWDLETDYLTGRKQQGATLRSNLDNWSTTFYFQDVHTKRYHSGTGKLKQVLWHVGG